MKNPFKIGEKVVTKVNGKDMEAIVTNLWQNEVQVRTPDNELRWRSVYTVWCPGAAPLPREQKTTKSVGVAVGPNSSAAKAAPTNAKTKRSPRKPTKKRR